MKTLGPSIDSNATTNSNTLLTNHFITTPKALAAIKNNETQARQTKMGHMLKEALT